MKINVEKNRKTDVIRQAQKTTMANRAAHIQDLAVKSRQKIEREASKEFARTNWHWLRKKLFHFVHSYTFEVTCALVILFNMVLVVIETDSVASTGDSPWWVEMCTYVLLCFYTMELTLKMYASQWEFFEETWNIIDLIIVGTDIIFVVITFFAEDLPAIAILRVFRLVRLLRAFKAAKAFRELKALLRSCACAVKAIFWGMVMVLMVLLVWGILAVQLIHPINQHIAENKPQLYAGCERCPRAYATVFDSMLTFFKQLVAGDSWGTLCEPIIEEAKWTSIFFMFTLVTVSLTMLNCILAVVVEAGAAAAAADDHEQAMAREKSIFEAEERLIDLCHGLDSDGSGSLTVDEFFRGFKENADFKHCLELMHVTEADMLMIFNICDEDDSGDVDYREFVEQLRRIKHSAEQMILHYVTDIRHKVNKIKSDFLMKTPRQSPKALSRLFTGSSTSAIGTSAIAAGSSTAAATSQNYDRSDPFSPKAFHQDDEFIPTVAEDGTRSAPAALQLEIPEAPVAIEAQITSDLSIVSNSGVGGVLNGEVVEFQTARIKELVQLLFDAFNAKDERIASATSGVGLRFTL